VCRFSEKPDNESLLLAYE